MVSCLVSTLGQFYSKRSGVCVCVRACACVCVCGCVAACARAFVVVGVYDYLSG
jgi:hypothetical protein